MQIRLESFATTSMCTLALFRDVSPIYPLVIAANRDEYLERAALPPALLADPAGVVAGKDLEAGGTWLGCRVDGGVAGRRSAQPARGGTRRPRAAPLRSRGLLCLDALRCGSVAEALAGLDRSGRRAVRPASTCCLADLERAVVVDNRDGCRCHRARSTGLSVLTNLAVNDPRCPRLASAHAGFARCPAAELQPARSAAPKIVEALGSVLSDHEGFGRPHRHAIRSRACACTPGLRNAVVVDDPRRS